MIVKRDFHYSPTGQNRPLHIWLPDSYDHSDERYPVMYFFDGHNMFTDADATYGTSWGMLDFMNAWNKPMIIVGMECGHDGHERLHEYSPYCAKLPWAPGDGSEFLGDQTFEWLIHEVKPLIDREFRTIPFRECTGIGGSSMGGLMALYGAVHHNIWFSKAACVSSAIGFCMEAIRKDIESSNIDPDTRVYLSWGTREARVKDPTAEDISSESYLRNKECADRITESGARTRLYCQVGGAHCEADWARQVPLFMNFLWQDQ